MPIETLAEILSDIEPLSDVTSLFEDEEMDSPLPHKFHKATAKSLINDEKHFTFDHSSEVSLNENISLQ